MVGMVWRMFDKKLTVFDKDKCKQCILNNRNISANIIPYTYICVCVCVPVGLRNVL